MNDRINDRINDQLKEIQVEADSMVIYQPRYTDAKKERIKALVRVFTGEIVEMEAAVRDPKSSLIRDIFAQYTPEEIGFFTEREARIIEQKKKVSEQVKEDHKRDEEREITFQAKTKALEAPEVLDCKDPRIATKIRKAKNPFEVAGWLAVAFMLSLENEK